MIPGIDGRPAQAQKMAGISVYTHEITNNLSCESRLFIRSPLKNKILKANPLVRSKMIRFPSYRWKFDQIWERTALPFMARNSDADIFWGPRFYVPGRLGMPSVASIHDIAFVLLKGIVTQKQIDFFDLRIRESLKNATHFIAVSETTKKDFCDHYRVNPDKVSVVYNGFNEEYAAAVDKAKAQDILKKYKIRNDFILFLGTLEPRKNLPRLIDAYINSRAKKEGIPLVLAGKMGWMQDELMRKIKPLIDQGLIILTGYLSNEELKVLYNKCLFFAFPSVYEGFGIPVIEAMASGAAVLTSGSSSLKELFSGSALLVDPVSVESVKEGINQLMDRDLRDSYRKKGSKRVKDFSWKKSAEEHQKVFEKLL